MEETGAIVCMKHLSRTIWEESVRDGAGLGLQGGRDDVGAAGTRGDEDAMTAPWMRRLRFTPVTNPFPLEGGEQPSGQAKWRRTN